VRDEPQRRPGGKKEESLGVVGWLVLILAAPVVIGAVLAWHFGPLLLFDWLVKTRAEHPVLSWVGIGVIVLAGVLIALAQLFGRDKGK
jgi:hypothetical protein